MIKGEYKKILFEIFDALEFSDDEKTAALKTFKKRLANELLKSITGGLSEELQKLIKDNSSVTDAEDPKILELRGKLAQFYKKEELQEKSRPIFKKILKEYVEFVANAL